MGRLMFRRDEVGDPNRMADYRDIPDPDPVPAGMDDIVLEPGTPLSVFGERWVVTRVRFGPSVDPDSGRLMFEMYAAPAAPKEPDTDG